MMRIMLAQFRARLNRFGPMHLGKPTVPWHVKGFFPGGNAFIL